MSDYVKVTLEMEEKELLQCAKCDEMFNGTAVIYLDVDEKLAEEVWCVPCDLRRSKPKANSP